jgi:hypothetical protein
MKAKWLEAPRGKVEVANNSNRLRVNIPKHSIDLLYCQLKYEYSK